jgi:micrococcal nuclease
MEYIFLLIFLLSSVYIIAGLIKPSIYTKLFRKKLPRRSILFTGILSLIVSVTGIGLTTESHIITPQEKPEVLESTTENIDPETQNEEVSSFSIVSENVKSAKILRAVDGDTVEVLIDSTNERVRVIGIDTPETVDPRKLVECFGVEASNKAKELLKVGSEVYLERDPSQDNRDKYSRLLRYIWINENLDFGKYMIEEGYAYEYTYKHPYKYQEEYKNAQKQAEEDKKGLWADNVCVTAPTSQPTSKPINYPTARPTAIPTVYVAPTSAPNVYLAPTSPPLNTSTNTGGSWLCNCSKTCPNMSSCEEAYFQLNTCGCSIRDGDKDSVPCENICPGG